MHHSTKRRVVLGMTTGGLLITGIGMAQADAAATGTATGSPGVLSGNLVQIPVDAPINVCGNVVDVIGVLDSAVGNHCGNGGPASGGDSASANGSAKGSPGIGSGNLVQIPVDAPINVCGNSISGVGVGDTAAGDDCSNGGGQGTNGAGASGGSHGSPGIGSGNTVQAPVDTPVNLCGDQVSVVGVGDTAAGNDCSNGGGSVTPPTHTHQPPTSCGCPPPATSTPPSTTTTPTGTTPRSGGRHAAPRHSVGTLAETGTGARDVVAPFGASILGGGGLLLRKRAGSLLNLTNRH
jgi:hypothetical protein